MKGVDVPAEESTLTTFDSSFPSFSPFDSAATCGDEVTGVVETLIVSGAVVGCVMLMVTLTGGRSETIVATLSLLIHPGH